MKYHQIRNATAHIDFAGARFLIDPMLSDKDAFPGFPGTVNNHLRNPTVELPIPVSEVLVADAVIVTHTHADHWDEAAMKLVPKDMPIFAQHEADRKIIQGSGFTDVRLLDDKSEFKGISLIKTDGQHGSDDLMASEFGELIGEACGVVFKHPDEKIVYLVGDTVWNDKVQVNLAKYKPEIVILNAGDARMLNYGSIIMGKNDVMTVHKAAPNATLIATHMESVNHSVLSRAELRKFADENGMADCLHIPKDNEICSF